MKKLYRTLLNWRTIVLALLATPALLFLLCECEEIIMLFIIKFVGFGLAYLVYHLGKYWNSQGKINELMELINEED